MGQYSIKEVETLSGVKAHTLRIWEQRYDFLKPRRTDTNIRYYTDEQLRLLLNIGILNRNGLKISKIAAMNKEAMNQAVLHIQETTTVPDQFLDSLVQSMIDFDERRFEKTISSAILKLGFEEAFNKLIFPFMIRTGLLWSTGAVSVAQEHFITHLIRRKIFAAIDSQFGETSEKGRKFVLFLPEGETHELLLLFTEYILRKHGHHVLYLGTSMPLSYVIDVVKTHKPDYMITYITIPMQKITLKNYLNKVSDACSKCKLLVGGSQIQNLKPIANANLKLINSAEDLLAIAG